MSIMMLRDVTKTYTGGAETVSVLHGVSLDVAAGETVALEGPSGSGKTTLLCIAGCILSPCAGDVTIAGRRVERLKASALAGIRRDSIGFIFQQYHLFPSLTAAENVEYALNVRGHRGSAARTTAREMLDRVGLSERAHFKPRDLSGGQKQRVAIARAMASRPPLLLADEPTANLDSAAGAQILALFRAMAREDGVALLIVTHDTAVRSVVDRVLRMRDGRISNEQENAA